MSAWTPGEMESLRAWIESAGGLRARDYRDSFLERRAGSRIAATGCTGLRDYLAFLDGHPDERRALVAKLLVPTTEFFRNPEVFASLGRLLGERSSALGWKRLRVLSAPCSTGEEAVSLAILLAGLRLGGRVLAADRSVEALRRLRRGSFPARGLERLDMGQIAGYFRVEGDRATVSPGIARAILPVCWDLGQGLPGRGFHVVAMRNLFIYLTPQAQGRLLAAASSALVPGGLLVLGRVESVGRSGTGSWRVVDREARIYEWAGGRA